MDRRHGAPKGPYRWKIDQTGNIENFSMKTLRNDVLYRLQSGAMLYTVGECKIFISEMVRISTQWQEEELMHLCYLSELHKKLIPGHQIVYQWPPASTPSIPFASRSDIQDENASLFALTKVVEELNRSLIRMIDKLWNDRRERLLLTARILKDLESVALRE